MSEQESELKKMLAARKAQLNTLHIQGQIKQTERQIKVAKMQNATSGFMSFAKGANKILKKMSQA